MPSTDIDALEAEFETINSALSKLRKSVAQEFSQDIREELITKVKIEEGKLGRISDEMTKLSGMSGLRARLSLKEEESATMESRLKQLEKEAADSGFKAVRKREIGAIRQAVSPLLS